MKIPLYNRPELLNTGDLTFKTPTLRADGGEAIAKGIGIAANVLGDIAKKQQSANEMNILLEQEKDLNNELLEFEKWKNQPDNLNREDTWEGEAARRGEAIRNKYSQISMTPETRLKLQGRSQDWEDRLRINAYGDSLKRKGEITRNNLNILMNNAEISGDYSMIPAYIDEAVNRGIYTIDSGNVLKQEVNNAQRKKQINDLNNLVQADLDASAFETAKVRIDNAESQGLISPTDATAQRTRIEYKFQYNQKLENVGMEVEENPSKVLSELGTTNTIDQTVAETGIPAPAVDYVTFIKNVEGFTPTAQWDYAQYSVGYGTRGTSGESLTKEQADARLREELKQHETRVDTMAKEAGMTLTENQRAALISYDFNTGRVEGVFKRAGGDPTKIGQAIRNGIKTADGKVLQGLVNRRNNEAALAESGTGSPTPASGPLAFLSPTDRYKVQQRAEAVLAQKASDQFRTFREALDIGQIPTVTDTGVEMLPIVVGQQKKIEEVFIAPTGKTQKMEFPSEIARAPFSIVENNPQFREMLADPITRASAEFYFNAKQGKASINDPYNYEQTINAINEYSQKYASTDTSGIKKAGLQTMISGMFSEHYEKELLGRLDTLSGGRGSSSSITSDAISTLNRLAFGPNQGLGKFKTQKMSEAVPGKEQSLFGIDYLWKDIPATPSRPIVTTPDIEVLDESGKVIKKKGVPVPVEVEDPEQRLMVAEKVAIIRQTLENEAKLGLIKTREEALKRMKELYSSPQFGGKYTISNSTTEKASSSTQTARRPGYTPPWQTK